MRKNIIAKKKQTACYKKSASGITLVSLVVTIIVLLILAGVSITAALGDNGIITRAQKAEKELALSAEQERLDLLKLEMMLDVESDEGKSAVDIYKDHLIEEGILDSENVTPTPEGGYTGITDEGYEIEIKPNPENPNDPIVEVIGQAGKLPVKIVNVNLTTGTNYIDVNVTVERGEGATYSYYYKKAGEEYKTWKKDISGTSTRIEGLEQNVIYTIKVEATNENETVSEEATGTTGAIVDLNESNTTFSYSTTAPTKNDVTVTISTTVTGYTLQYSTDGAAWNNYTGSIPMSTNGTIYAKLVDSTGQEGGAATGNVSNIDKLLPNSFTPTIGTTTNSIVISGSTTDVAATSENASSGISKYYFSKDNGATWEPTAGQTGTSYTFSGLTQGTTYNFKMKAVDVAGNEIITTTQAAGTISVPSAVGNVTITESSGVQVTLATSITGYTLQYRIGTGSWTNYTQAFTVSSSSLVYARFIDETGQYGAELSKGVGSNYFSVSVSSSSVNNYGFTLNATGTSANTISRYEFYVNSSLNNTVTSSNTTASLAISNLSAGTTYSCYVVMYDTQGNSTKSSSINVTTTTICFVENTKVLTEEGLRNIQEIKVGDYVYSKNEATGEIELKEVTELFVNEIGETFKVYTNETVIEATGYHPWYVVGKGYVETEDLEVGDKLVDVNGNEIEITNIERFIKPENIKVYNIEVEDNNNYFVGEKSYLVHNYVYEI